MLTAKSLIRIQLRDLKHDELRALHYAETFKRKAQAEGNWSQLYNESAWKNEARLIRRFRRELGDIYRLINLGYA